MLRTKRSRKRAEVRRTPGAERVRGQRGGRAAASATQDVMKHQEPHHKACNTTRAITTLYTVVIKEYGLSTPLDNEPLSR